MPPVFVYLLPENFIGAVYVFFDQKDGVVPQPDPLGQAVHVPENGVVKLSGNLDDLMRSGRFNKRSEAMVMLDKNGGRRILRISLGTYRNYDGNFEEGYVDGDDKFHQFPVPPNPKAVDPRAEEKFYYLSASEMNERMVFEKDGCRHQAFVPNPEKIRSGEADGDKVGVPSCGKFLIASPKEFLEMPDWLWADPSNFLYESIADFETQANARLIQTKAFYGTAKPASASSN